VKKPFDPDSVNQIENLKLVKMDNDGTVTVAAAFEDFLARV